MVTSLALKTQAQHVHNPITSEALVGIPNVSDKKLTRLVRQTPKKTLIIPIQAIAQSCDMTLLLEKEMKGQTRSKRQPDNMHTSLNKANQVVSDGRIVISRRDTPGQHSVYIRPGDPCQEIYRLSTFEKVPEHSPVNPCQLAAEGFSILDTKIE